MKQLFLFICFPLSVFSQNTIGIPDIFNYPKQSYNAGQQNWDIKQDKNGIIYVANNEGLLSFDGKYWNLYPLPNKTIVRSVEIGIDNKIYVGGQDELGYFYPGSNGKLAYHSLTRFIPANDKSFGDVWDILSFNKNIFYRTENKIFKFIDESVATFNAPEKWTYLGLCKGRLYAHDNKTGLMRFDNDAWSPLTLKSDLPANDPVTGMLPLPGDSILITTLKHGLYLLADPGISKIPSVNNLLFETERIYAATIINHEWIALATNNSGVYITDHQGQIIQRFSRTEGLQNNNVLSVFLDNQGNLWSGLDNGIDLIAYNSAIKQIKPMLLDGSGYCAIVSGNQLYTGTTSGLYSVALQSMKDLSFSKGNFSPVANTNGQIWGLAEINNQLLLGKHEGAFVIKNNMAEPISSQTGFWNFVPLSGTFPSPRIVAGNYRGLQFFDFRNGQFIPEAQDPRFTESSRFVAIDKNDQIWVSHPYHGVYKITQGLNGSISRQPYTEKNGLPSLLNNHVYKIKNEVVLATEKGIYQYDPVQNRFEPSPYYQNLLGDQSIRYLKEDPSGNIWFIHEKRLGVADLSEKNPAIIYFPELNNKLLSGFEFVYPVDENNIFLSAEKGFFHINYEKYKRTVPDLRVHIRTVRIVSNKDSLLFGGYFSSGTGQQARKTRPNPGISYRWKTIRFEFSSPLFGYPSNLEYSFRLKGFDPNWSDWTNRTEKEYTNLPAGSYSFEVKVRSNLGNESAADVYSFTVRPPWYLTTGAKIFYLLLLVAGLFVLYHWQQKKFRQQQEKYEAEQNKLRYIHELELNKSESELMALRNEKLEAEINFKNSEMASSAMHLVKKGELLSKIKTELTQVMKGLDNPQAAADLKKMIRTLSDDDNMDKEWENFAIHFDKVHSDFVVVLKEQHPTITPNELKLCAYLRMNLSTKEIAQLMNISVRGVEISRYRLRKKLKIPSETNLFNYLINIQIKS